MNTARCLKAANASVFPRSHIKQQSLLFVWLPGSTDELNFPESLRSHIYTGTLPMDPTTSYHWSLCGLRPMTSQGHQNPHTTLTDTIIMMFDTVITCYY